MGTLPTATMAGPSLTPEVVQKPGEDYNSPPLWPSFLPGFPSHLIVPDTNQLDIECTLNNCPLPSEKSIQRGGRGGYGEEKGREKKKLTNGLGEGKFGRGVALYTPCQLQACCSWDFAHCFWAPTSTNEPCVHGWPI